jgi:hypothetical protein
VLGIPVASPSVGRIVVLFYSRFDRPNDPDLVTSLMEKLTKVLKVICRKYMLARRISDTQPRFFSVNR